jgi:hypothetical protein
MDFLRDWWLVLVLIPMWLLMGAAVVYMWIVTVALAYEGAKALLSKIKS